MMPPMRSHRIVGRNSGVHAGDDPRLVQVDHFVQGLDVQRDDVRALGARDVLSDQP